MFHNQKARPVGLKSSIGEQQMHKDKVWILSEFGRRAKKSWAIFDLKVEKEGKFYTTEDNSNRKLSDFAVLRFTI